MISLSDARIRTLTFVEYHGQKKLCLSRIVGWILITWRHSVFRGVYRFPAMQMQRFRAHITGTLPSTPSHSLVPIMISWLYNAWNVTGYMTSSSPGRIKNFLFFTRSKSALGSTEPPIEGVSGGSLLEGKAAGREADHTPPAGAEVKKMWIYTSTPQYAFMA
jgi:hypothetical protein